MKYIGGYSILDLTDANVSAQANACYNQDKPVLVYGTNGERYFADTITKSGTSIIITKGGKTITIANDNTITNVGDIQNHLYLYRINLNDYSFNITLPFKFDRFSVASNDDLTPEIVDILKKIFNMYTNNVLNYSTFSANSEENSEIIMLSGYITKATNTFTLRISYYTNGSNEVQSATFNEDFTSVTLSDSDLYVDYLAQIY